MAAVTIREISPNRKIAVSADFQNSRPNLLPVSDFFQIILKYGKGKISKNKPTDIIKFSSERKLSEHTIYPVKGFVNILEKDNLIFPAEIVGCAEESKHTRKISSNQWSGRAGTVLQDLNIFRRNRAAPIPCEAVKQPFPGQLGGVGQRSDDGPMKAHKAGLLIQEIL